MFEPAFRVGNGSAPIIGFNFTALKQIGRVHLDVPWEGRQVKVRVTPQQNGTLHVRAAQPHERTDGTAYVVTPTRQTGQITSKPLYMWVKAHGYQPGRSYTLVPHVDDSDTFVISPHRHIGTQYPERTHRSPDDAPKMRYTVERDDTKEQWEVMATSPRDAIQQVVGFPVRGGTQLHPVRGGWRFHTNKRATKWNVTVDLNTIGVTDA